MTRLNAEPELRLDGRPETASAVQDRVPGEKNSQYAEGKKIGSAADVLC
jgi:hypothetical protein